MYCASTRGLQCFCSAVGDDYEEYGTATCSDACGGRSSEICGDSYALSVYEYTSVSPAPGAPTPAPEAPTPVPTAQLQPTPVPTSTMEPTPLSSGANAPTIPTPSPAETTYTRVGCYTDSKADRLLAADSTSTSLMTTEVCGSESRFCCGRLSSLCQRRVPFRYPRAIINLVFSHLRRYGVRLGHTHHRFTAEQTKSMAILAAHSTSVWRWLMPHHS